MEMQNDAAYAVQHDCSQRSRKPVTVADIKQISPEVAAEVDSIRASNDITKADACQRLSRLLDPDTANGAVKIVCSDGTVLTPKEKTAIVSTLSKQFRKRVDNQWNKDVVDFERWGGRGWHFLEQLGFISTRMVFKDFAPLANGALYELRGRKYQRGEGLQLPHLIRIRQHLDEQDVKGIVPIHSISNIPVKDRPRYKFDQYKLMHDVAAEKVAEQMRLFSRVRLQPGDLGNTTGEKAINWCTRGFLGNPKVLARKAATQRRKLEKMQQFCIETDFDWEFMAMPYRDDGWWYVAYWISKTRKWAILSLSQDAPRPYDWSESEMRVITKTQHSRETTAFLAVACMKDILNDCARFMDMVDKGVDPGWDVEAIKKMVIASLAQEKTKNDKGDGKTGEQNENGTVSGTGGSKVGKDWPELLGGRGPSFVGRPPPKEKEPEPNSHPAGANASADNADVAPTTRKRRLRLVSYMADTQSIDTLRDGRLANDNMVSFGLNKEVKEYPEADLFPFNSFLVENLEREKSCYGWSKGFDVSTHRRILLPLHDKGMKHWRLVLLWRGLEIPSSKPCDYKMVILDPLQPYTTDGHVFRLLKEYFDDEKLGIRLEAVQPPPDLPQQVDHFNCGIYVWQYAKCYLQDPNTFEDAAEQGKSVRWKVDAQNGRALLRKAAMEDLRIKKRPGIVGLLNSDDDFFLSVANLLDTHRPTSPFSPGEYEFQPNKSGGSSSTDCLGGMADDDDMQITTDPGSPALPPVGRKRGAS